jgi:hypothetical protein
MTDTLSEVDDATQTMSDDMNTANQSASSSAMSLNSCALSGMALYMSFNNVENASVSLDRAHLMVQKSTVAVEVAQNAYNAAVAKFGADSPQAQLALQKLQNAQDALKVSQERADEAQRTYNNSIMMAALTVIPSLVAVINTVGNATKIWTGIQAALDAVMDANPIVLVALAIAGLVAAIILAYNACPPFRDAVKEIAAIMGTELKLEVEVIITAFTWLWNNILKPLGDFLEGAFTTCWKDLAAVFEWFYNLVKPIIDAIEGASKAMGTFVNDVSGAMKDAGGAIQGFIKSICFAHALADASESSKKTMADWVVMVRDSMDKGLSHIKEFNSQAQAAGLSAAPGVGGAAGVGGLPTSMNRPSTVTVVTQAPLINIEGSADKATVQLASQQVLQALKTIVVEPTSSGAASTQKRIRSGSVFS